MHITILNNKKYLIFPNAGRCSCIDAHRGVGGEGGMKQHPPRQIFKKLVKKNAIKCKIGGPPLQIFLKPLTPPRNFGKNIPYPLPWISNPCASMVFGYYG